MSQQGSGSSRFSFATSENAAVIEDMYEQFRQDPDSVDPTWQNFFKGYEFAARGDGGEAAGADEVRDNAKVEALINAYRRLGHLSADLDPLADEHKIRDEMMPAAHGLIDVPESRRFHPANLPQDDLTLSEIVELLQTTYCGRIGADFRELNDIESVTWLQDQMESCRNQPSFDVATKKRILEKLTQSEGFEQFLGRRYIGQKRFSLEGAESLIPMLDTLVSDAADAGVDEACLGMAHRGRLNVLANFMGKSYELMLKEFEGSEYNPFDIDGDVKYHKGFASEVETANGKRIRLYLSPNPSHLEAVNPVVEGFVRARQRLLNDSKRSAVLPILMHGDASFIGQGVVAETLNLAELDAYTTGGTVHIIINNQIGFTTEPEEGRSSPYASAFAKIIRAPVLHVNADDPEAAVWCAQLATAYRQKFGRDIVIDLIGYRRHGHNEGDEPAFTQPHMYKKIGSHPTVLTKYTDSLAASGSIDAATSKAISKEFRARMQAAYDAVHGKDNVDLPAPVIPAALQKSMMFKKAERSDIDEVVKTGVKSSVLAKVAQALTAVPDGFNVHPKLKRLLESRAGMLNGDGKVDWGFGELLAFATLAVEGYHVRVSGQDVGRGTFTSRHGMWRDVETGARHNSVNHVEPGKQADVHLINSPLSEQGCLGFEFGYSVADPDALVAWEAQFGDFANGAQIIIDQFLSASEAKWKQTSGLVLLLPHGHEGQGPEHSSARPERFLQLCGNLNMQVVLSTTPAQHFHALRRQLHRDFRKPLVVMTPKSLLRHPQCVSTTADFTDGYFREVIEDDSIKDVSKVERAIVCSGKIYYELIKARDEHDEASAKVPIIRLEQPYPFPYDPLKQALAAYPNLKEIVWTQEEPQNMGCWSFVLGRFRDGVLQDGQSLRYVGRKNSGTPAEGSGKAHEAEQQRILQDALGLACGWSPDDRKKVANAR